MATSNSIPLKIAMACDEVGFDYKEAVKEILGSHPVIEFVTCY